MYVNTKLNQLKAKYLYNSLKDYHHSFFH